MPLALLLNARRIWRALAATIRLLTNIEVMRAMPWTYIRRLPRTNVRIGMITATLSVSLVLSLLALAISGPMGSELAVLAVFVAIFGAVIPSARGLKLRSRSKR